MSYAWGWVSIIVIVVALLIAATPSHAAAPTPISDNCEQTATVGLVELFYCEMPYGPDVIINSYGFVVVVD